MSKSLFHELAYQTDLFRYDDGGDVSYSTHNNYKSSIHQFADFCKDNGIRHMKDMPDTESRIAALQNYADNLKGQYKASTIHTYLAAPCKALGVDMAAIDKPLRVAADFEKSAPAAPSCRVEQFARMVGLRSSEYIRLHGYDLVEYRGELCVHLDKGKGGKEQWQRILPQYIDAVRAYFDGSSDKVFSMAEINEATSCQAQRREVAQEAYKFYADNYTTPDARKELYDRIAARWHAENKAGHRDKLEPRSYFDHPYILRGANREYAIEHGLPVSYDRLAMRAASIEHLSHWRDNITVQSYLLQR